MDDDQRLARGEGRIHLGNQLGEHRDIFVDFVAFRECCSASLKNLRFTSETR
jgi:hypothetical protein